jgi:hypothetical protein
MADTIGSDPTHGLPVIVPRGAQAFFPSAILAIGVLSAPDNWYARREIRQTWMRRDAVPPDVEVRIVTQQPARARELWLREGLDDTLLVAYDGDSSRSAWRKQWVWLSYALRAFPRARYVCTTEDDVFVHAPGVRHVLTQPPLGNASALHYVGNAHWYSWLPSIGCPIAYAKDSDQARRQFCAVCGPGQGAQRIAAGRRAARQCFGPFLYHAGAFHALSRSLISKLVESGARAEADDPLAPACPRSESEQDARAGKPDILSPDVWLGMALRRHLAHTPLQIFAFEPHSRLIASSWNGNLVSRATFAMHDKMKTARWIENTRSHQAALAAANAKAAAYSAAARAAASHAAASKATASAVAVAKRAWTGDSPSPNPNPNAGLSPNPLTAGETAEPERARVADDSGWSRMRRAHAFASRFYCAPLLEAVASTPRQLSTRGSARAAIPPRQPAPGGAAPGTQEGRGAGRRGLLALKRGWNHVALRWPVSWTLHTLALGGGIATCDMLPENASLVANVKASIAPLILLAANASDDDRRYWSAEGRRLLVRELERDV